MDTVTLGNVEIESQYSGGNGAWSHFMLKNLHYPDKAVIDRIQGVIVVQFIVQRDGSVSDIHSIFGTNDGGL